MTSLQVEYLLDIVMLCFGILFLIRFKKPIGSNFASVFRFFSVGVIILVLNHFFDTAFLADFLKKTGHVNDFFQASIIHRVVNLIGLSIMVAGYFKLLRLSEKEQEVDKAKTEFVSLVSHQLQTPLTIIRSYTDLLLEGSVGKLNKEEGEFIKNIKNSSDRMSQLVKSYLNVSRIDLNTFSIEPESVDIISIANQNLKSFAEQIKKKKLKIIKNFDKKILIINADPKIINIVFQNLISNAIKYNQIKGKIEISVTKKDLDILIVVKDDGYGIPKNQQDKVFTKLFRGDNVVQKVREGTGLGLYIIKSVLERIQGKIWFESEENKGTSFSVLLPIETKPRKGTKNLL